MAASIFCFMEQITKQGNKTMPYVGKRPIPATHPLAHDVLLLGGQENLAEEALPLGRHGVTVTVSWGYELHSVRIGTARWRRNQVIRTRPLTSACGLRRG